MRDSTTRRSLAPSLPRSRESRCVDQRCTKMSAFVATKMLVAASMLAAASATVDIAWTATQRDKGGALEQRDPFFSFFDHVVQSYRAPLGGKP